MKITLRPKRNDSASYPCCVIVDTETEKAFCCAVAKTWAEAEAEAIARAKAQLDAGPPPLERIIEL